MSIIQINNFAISYNERGEGQAVLFVHGFPLDSRIWDLQLDDLSDLGRIITMDLPGFGESIGELPFTIRGLADVIHELIGQIGARRCVLAGLSMGGYVALAHATAYPEDLAGLILIDTRAEGDTAEGKQNRMKMVEAVRKGGSKVVAEQMMPKMLSEGTLKKRPDLVKKVRDIMEACPPITIENALIAMRDRDDFTDRLASIACPTLILVGDQDAITPPAMSEAMAKNIPDAKLKVISDCGHLSSMEQAEQVSKAIRSFLITLV